MNVPKIYTSNNSEHNNVSPKKTIILPTMTSMMCYGSDFLVVILPDSNIILNEFEVNSKILAQKQGYQKSKLYNLYYIYETILNKIYQHIHVHIGNINYICGWQFSHI
jgi:hypothetical protein